ncbi:MAG: hypothetical protein WBN35_02620 [Acidimicrobiia bacterium]
MTTTEARAEGFTAFVEDVEPGLRLALCSAFGRQVGLDATAEAPEYGWEHWERIRVTDECDRLDEVATVFFGDGSGVALATLNLSSLCFQRVG